MRAIWGAGLLLAAGVLAILAWVGLGPVRLWVALSVLLALGGVFALFEARRGWCAVRALGIKTPM